MQPKMTNSCNRSKREESSHVTFFQLNYSFDSNVKFISIVILKQYQDNGFQIQAAILSVVLPIISWEQYLGHGLVRCSTLSQRLNSTWQPENALKAPEQEPQQQKISILNFPVLARFWNGERFSAWIKKITFWSSEISLAENRLSTCISQDKVSQYTVL